ncbi:XdhC family protein [Natrialba swarupiae]|uniref:YHS domain-containing protein n=1 Tax=Natrialba swarupiae TaxID=2448032 RepID=A0A5D5AMC0_9EURY|nr:XdhC family protein [Natrialba swarupiae]TYT62065.1 YHS domain-containing protein [Natrialba swarupiae]
MTRDTTPPDDAADGDPAHSDEGDPARSTEADLPRSDEGDEQTDETAVSTIERRLSSRREPYARATVVRREPPVSANVGDRAVVTADGELHGWIGGAACAQSIVAAEAQAAIEADEARLIGIAPDPDRIDRAGLEAFPMRCHSEGILEVFLEPVNTAPDLLLVGDSPVARSLARLASELTFDVTLVAGESAGLEGSIPAGTTVLGETDPETVAAAVDGEPIVVVASMGSFDARGVAAGVLADALYVGLVASDTRAEEVIDRAASILERDPEAVRAAVTNPAGVDVAAYTPAEIAASLLAEVVDVRGTAGGASGSYTPTSCGVAADSGDASSDFQTDDGVRDSGEELATDPVCGMTVDPADAPASVDHAGETYHFCCPDCADSFREDPDSYLEQPDETAAP